ncbi:hypothetical protein WJX73_009482 [Symbiochloris irregularis]|uniref:Anaphase-promoting complex subunit 13 n=1 Tax=Symbiochloris irregularis TaxID=706552 RepID=A0AAW1NW66_9CHLO
MSERLHYSLIGEPELLDVIDDEWLKATLPDDDLPVAGSQPQSAEDPDGHHAGQKQPPEKWAELALHSVN